MRFSVTTSSINSSWFRRVKQLCMRRMLLSHQSTDSKTSWIWELLTNVLSKQKVNIKYCGTLLKYGRTHHSLCWHRYANLRLVYLPNIQLLVYLLCTILGIFKDFWPQTFRAIGQRYLAVTAVSVYRYRIKLETFSINFRPRYASSTTTYFYHQCP